MEKTFKFEGYVQLLDLSNDIQSTTLTHKVSNLVSLTENILITIFVKFSSFLVISF